MSINTLSTFGSIKKKHNQLMPSIPNCTFIAPSGSGISGILVERQSNTGGAFATTRVNKCATLEGYDIFPFWVYWNNGANKLFRFYIAMIRNSDRQLQMQYTELFRAGSTSSLSYSSSYMDSGVVYLNFVDNNTATNHHVTYTYSSNTFSGINSNHVTTGTIINSTSLTNGGRTYAPNNWELLSTNYYYGLVVEVTS